MASNVSTHDLYYFVKNYKDGVAGVLGAIRPDIDHGLVKEAVAKIRHHFKTIDSSGSAQVVRFLELDDADDIAAVRRDVYEIMATFLAGVDSFNRQ
ncbi:hypothetical protein KBI23_18160 [bacterium]|nr:hypothetical protein [bacterium]MBP9811709.1 hypothetical protein [bacterium]